MKLTWYGHACFMLENAQGVRVATDPYDDSVGYPMREISADAVLMSHSHHDHSCRDMLAGNPLVLDERGQYEVENVRITGFASFHDDRQGALRGKNVMNLIEMDGVRVLHAGDLGELPSVQTVEKIGRVDVLLLPVGGTYTLTGEQAAQAAKAFDAAVTIPMHYKAPCVAYPLTDEWPFLASMGAMDAPHMAQLNLTPDSVRSLPRVVVMNWEE